MVSNNDIKYIKQKALDIRKDIVDMIGVGMAGHLGGSCSCADIVSTLYFYKMKFDPKNPKWDGRDRFLLSKGHAALAQYAALIELGVIPRNEVKRVKSLGSMLQGHPDMTKAPGIEANTGSLGQGLSVAVGMALGLKLDKSDSRVYVIVGDGEQQEGQIWEAAIAAAYYKADNLVAIVDKNRLQATGPIIERYNHYPLEPKWTAFGWNAITIDGHDVKAIASALDLAENIKGKPTVIIAETIKGKGISFAEGNPDFHNGTMTNEQYELALNELMEQQDKLEAGVDI